MDHQDEIIKRLLAGEAASTIARSFSLSTRIVQDGTAILLPGWIADDGNCEITYPNATSGDEAAREYGDGYDWGEYAETFWLTVWAWRVGVVRDERGDVYAVEIDRDSYTIAIDPDEPACLDGENHDWQSPHEIVGGIESNPGVWGHGGGVVITECCVRCGCARITNTWAQNPETGEQGLQSVTYEPDRFRDEIAEVAEVAE